MDGVLRLSFKLSESFYGFYFPVRGREKTDQFDPLLDPLALS